MSHRQVNRCLFSALFMMTIMTALPAGAEDELQLDTILVTADKQTEDLQEVAASITALPEERIKDSGIRKISDVAKQVPNLYIANWGMRGNSYVFVRGLGAVDNAPAVGFYVDDVNYMNARTFDTDLYDVERIEVLRGPQGTLYGRNSLGGVINIITKKPDNNFRFGLEQTFSNYSGVVSTLTMRTPLIEDRLFLGLSGTLDRRDGFNDNDYLSRDVDYRKDLNGRLNLRWTPTDDWDISASLDRERLRDGAFPLNFRDEVLNNPYHANYNVEGKNERDVKGASFRVRYSAPWFDVTSISAFREYDDLAWNDQDFMPYDMATALENINNRQFTQELRFSSPDDGRDTKWVGGLYYYKTDEDHALDLNYGQDAVYLGLVPMPMSKLDRSNLKTDGYAVFGQVTQTFFDKLDLTAGLRYEYGDSQIKYRTHMEAGGMTLFPATHINKSLDDSQWLPKFQVAYNWTDDLMTYLSAAKGYRSGGFNSSSVTEDQIAFDPEHSWNYEAGFKSAWADHRLTLNGAFFYIDLKNQQITQTLPTADMFIKNAGKSRSLGFELEAAARLTENLTLDAGFGYTDSKYKSHFDPVTGVSYKGNRTPMAPKYTYNLGLQYRHLIGESNLFGGAEDVYFFSRAELQGVGPFYWDDANALKQSGYGLVNLRLGLESEHLDLIFWGKNVLGKDYQCVSFGFLGTDALAQAGDPRTFGVTLRAKF